MPFDAKRFETLSGYELGLYVEQLLPQGIAESEFLPYFRDNVAAMDVAHLYIGIIMLGSVGTDAACLIASDYFEHPEFIVRKVAICAILRMERINETLMARVTESLAKHEDDPYALAQELRIVLDRPANGAAAYIAAEYRAQRKIRSKG